jgi:hypothetical protein
MFKAGNKVKCLKTLSSTMQKDEVYTITSVKDEWVRFDGKASGWHHRYFRPVNSLVIEEPNLRKFL